MATGTAGTDIVRLTTELDAAPQVTAYPKDIGTLASWSEKKLDGRIKTGHGTVGAHARSFAEASIITGIYLREKQRRLGSRKFAPWVEENFDGSLSTANRYLALAKKYAPVKALIGIAADTDETVEAPAKDAPKDETTKVDAADESGQKVEAEVVPEDETVTVATTFFKQLIAVEVDDIPVEELDSFEKELRDLLALIEERKAAATPKPKRRRTKAVA